MKAKRIVSILLTGSMLLSLLPVSALAAAPVFDAPAQTTAKKAAPLVQEADASRSTEEEAATRSSRDLDAENGTAESITTIQLNAAGKPASEYGQYPTGCRRSRRYYPRCDRVARQIRLARHECIAIRL